MSASEQWFECKGWRRDDDVNIADATLSGDGISLFRG